jgi:hypothetical protein
MAEVAIAVAEAIKYVAISVAVVAIVGLLYTLYYGLYQFIPYFGAIHLGSLTYLVLKEINPIMGLGAAAAIIAFTFPMFQAIVISNPRYKDPTTNPTEISQGLNASAMVMGGGLGLGLSYSISGESLLVGALGAAAGAFLGHRYLWNGLVNFFVEFSLFPKGSGITSCELYGPATSTQWSQWQSWLASNKTLCNTNNYAAYCSSMEKYYMTCPRSNAGQPPPPPHYGPGGGPGASPQCIGYGQANTGSGPGDFGYYTDPSKNMAVIAKGTNWPSGQNCPIHTMVPMENAQWTSFAPGAPAMSSPGVVVIATTYTFPAGALEWMTPNGPNSGPYNNASGQLEPGVYVVQHGIADSSAICIKYDQANIQGPFPPNYNTESYEQWGPRAVSSQNPDPLVAPWAGRNFCAPAIKGAGGLNSPYLANGLIQPIDAERASVWGITAEADKTFAKNAGITGAIAPISLFDSGPTGIRYAWASAPGIYDQPTAAGIPLPPVASSLPPPRK